MDHQARLLCTHSFSGGGSQVWGDDFKKLIITAEEQDLERLGRVWEGRAWLAEIQALAKMGRRKKQGELGRKGASIYLGPAVCQAAILGI